MISDAIEALNVATCDSSSHVMLRTTTLTSCSSRARGRRFVGADECQQVR
jgi:hypothetical protein